MRISSLKGARAGSSSAARPEIRGSPDFLWNLVASVNFMRLSEKKQVLLVGEALAYSRDQPF
jgi:hypothetical protein